VFTTWAGWKLSGTPTAHDAVRHDAILCDGRGQNPKREPHGVGYHEAGHAVKLKGDAMDAVCVVAVFLIFGLMAVAGLAADWGRAHGIVQLKGTRHGD